MNIKNKNTIIKAILLLGTSHIIANPDNRELSFVNIPEFVQSLRCPSSTGDSYVQLEQSTDRENYYQQKKCNKNFNFTPEMVKDAALMSSEAYDVLNRRYDEKSKIHDKFLIKFKTGINCIKNGGFVSIDQSTKQITIAFNGTDNANHMVTDGDFRTNAGQADLMTVGHNGILSSAKSAFDAIKALIKQQGINSKEFSFLLTGHSLGGGIAQHVAQLLLRSDDFGFNGVNDGRLGVITFGQPKILQQDSAKNYDKMIGENNFLRFNSSLDPVPNASSGILGYQYNYYHVGTSIAVNPADQATNVMINNYNNNPADLENGLFPRTVNLLRSLNPARTIVGGVVAQHSMDSYNNNASTAYANYLSNQTKEIETSVLNSGTTIENISSDDDLAVNMVTEDKPRSFVSKAFNTIKDSKALKTIKSAGTKAFNAVKSATRSVINFIKFW